VARRQPCILPRIVRARLAILPRLAARADVRDALGAFVLSRIVVMVAATLGALLLADGIEGGVPDNKVPPGFEAPFAGWPGGGILDAVLTPLVRWDALWYLTISQDGYQPLGLPGNGGERPAFFPLYPLLVRAFGGFAGPTAALLVSLALSAVALIGALILLHRLVALELGERYARPAVFLLAFFPSAYFLSAPYTESLFLLLTVGSVYAARTGHWARAGILMALASATRNTGVLLVVPLLLLHLDGRKGWRPGRDAAWLALAPLGLLAYSAYLQIDLGNALAWQSAQKVFGRNGFAIPVRTVWLGVRGTINAVRFPDFNGAANVLDLAVLGLLTAAVLGLLLRRRNVRLAYPAYAAAVLLPPLCAPFGGEALRSLPRFALVIFPLFMWLALVCERRGWTRAVVAGEGALLAVLAALFASWHPFV
jgi:Mannosyltransferase (PIG-V)